MESILNIQINHKQTRSPKQRYGKKLTKTNTTVDLNPTITIILNISSLNTPIK